MEKLLNISLLWFVFGFGLFLLEFLVPGFILFFFGIGAWVVAILTLFADIGINAQLIIFLGTSIFTVVLFRKWAKAKLGMYLEAPKKLEDEFIGKIALVESEITPEKNGKVEFKGTSWDAASTEFIAAGKSVQIIETKSIVLIVKPL